MHTWGSSWTLCWRCLRGGCCVNCTASWTTTLTLSTRCLPPTEAPSATDSFHPFVGLNARGSPFCLWSSDCLTHLPQVERGLVETLRPEAKYQMSLYPMSLYPMPLYNDTSPNHFLHILFSLLRLLFAICYLHTAHIVLQLLMLFYVSFILSYLSI